MKTALVDLLGSKKFLMALVAIGAAIAAHFGFDLDQTQCLELVTPLIAAILAQGAADHGLSAAKIAANTTTATEVAKTADSTVVVEAKRVEP